MARANCLTHRWMKEICQSIALSVLLAGGNAVGQRLLARAVPGAHKAVDVLNIVSLQLFDQVERIVADARERRDERFDIEQ